MKRKARFDELETMVKAAELYYISGLNQGEIAKILGVSRQKAFRLIKKARELGLVEIKIRRPAEADQALAQKIKEKYSLEDVVVARVYSEVPENVVKAIAQAGADYIKGKLVPYVSIGVAYGRTLWYLANYLPYLGLDGVKVIQLLGAYGASNWQALAIDLIRKFARKIGGEPVYLPSPAFAVNEEAKVALLHQKEIKEVLQLGENVDFAVVGIGGMERETSSLIATGNFDIEEIRELVNKGAVGAICGLFFNIEGNIVSGRITERRIGVNIGKILQNGGKVVAVAGGLDKKEAILGALRGRWVSSLITDENVARWLINR